MTDGAPDKPDVGRPSRQVIRSVSVNGYGKTRLVLQSVCGSDGRRYIRAVWEYRGEDGHWHTKRTPPEFSPAVWSDAIAKAATNGMLSSSDYKDLLVRLTRGLDASKSPTPKAFVRFTGLLQISFDSSTLVAHPVDEVLVYEKLSAPARDVTVTQSQQKATETTHLVYEVVEDIHYMEALSRLSEQLREVASKTSLEEAVAVDPRTAFEGIFGDAHLVEAGFVSDADLFDVEYSIAVL